MQVKTIQAEYIRDYSNPKNSRVIVKEGSEQLYIEQFALHFFEKQGYFGFHAENEFWETIGRLLFLEELLIPHQYKGEIRYGLWGIKEVKNRIEKQEYTHRLIEFGMSNLTNFIGDNAKRYMELSLFTTVEKEFSGSDKVSEYLCWFDIVVETFELNVLIPLFDWIFTNPFPGKSLTGMPDLLLFKNKKPAFAEVKSENDKLSSAQLSTLKFLSTNLGIEVYIFEAKEKLSIINQEQKNKFLEYHQQKNIKKKELKREIEKLTGIKISRKATYFDLVYRDEINLSAYIKLIEYFHKLGYHWVSFPLFREIPNKILTSNAKDIKKLNLNQIRDLGYQLKFIRDNSIIEEIICECKKYINIKLLKAN